MTALEAELRDRMRNMREEMVRADLLLQEGHLIKLISVLNRIEHSAQLAQYCIVDMADLAG